MPKQQNLNAPYLTSPVQRNPPFYLWNVVFVLFFVSLVTAVAFKLKPQAGNVLHDTSPRFIISKTIKRFPEQDLI